MKKAVGRKLTRIRPISSLVPILIKMCRIAFNSSLVSLPLETLKNILGLPALVGRGKKTKFHLHQEVSVKKLQGWKEKSLSQASREVLIKAVIQAIPTYFMSCFKLSKGLIKDLETMI